MSSKHCISRRGAIASASFAAASVALSTAHRAFAEDYSNSTLLASSDEIDFLYIDSSELKLGLEQNVVISLKNYSGVSSAELTATDVETGFSEVVPLAKTADSALLFAFTPAQEGAFEVSSLKYKVDGIAYELDFSDADASYRSYAVAAPVSTYANAGQGPELRVFSGEGEEELGESGSIEEAAAAAVAAASMARSVSSEKSGEIVVALDPGHVGAGSGSSGFGLAEETGNWKIAQYCKAELETYQGVRVVYTATPENPLNPSTELQDRVQRAVDQGASVLVSLHLNSSGGAGAEIWAPYNTNYNPDTHAVGVQLGEKILSQLTSLGLYNRGVKFRLIDDSTNDPKWDYDGGVTADYYGIIRYARRANLPAIIVEHAFIDNWNDYNNYLSSDAKLQSLGLADAHGIANYFGLTQREGTVFRLYHHGTLDHHYTKDAWEYQVLGGVGWTQEGVAWHSAPEGQGKPVYRLYHEGTKNHHYTMDAWEYKVLGGVGWTQEGIAWYSAPEDSGKPVYRLYHEGTLDHHYTMDAWEYKVLGGNGWTQEGIAWYSQE